MYIYMLIYIWKITFALHFCTYILSSYSYGFYIYINIYIHFLTFMHENRSGESRITACQTLWGQNQMLQKLIFLV